MEGICVDCQRGEHDECRRFGITCHCTHGDPVEMDDDAQQFEDVFYDERATED